MPNLIYTGPGAMSQEVAVGPASYLSLPKDAPCAIDDPELAERLMAADPGIVTVEEAPPPSKRRVLS